MATATANRDNDNTGSRYRYPLCTEELLRKIKITKDGSRKKNNAGRRKFLFIRAAITEIKISNCVSRGVFTIQQMK